MDFRNVLKKWCENPQKDTIYTLLDPQYTRIKISEKLMVRFYHILKKMYPPCQIANNDHIASQAINLIIQNTYILMPEDYYIIYGSYNHHEKWLDQPRLEYSLLYITKKGHNSIQELMKNFYFGKCLLHTRYTQNFRTLGKYNLKELELIHKNKIRITSYIYPTDIHAAEYLYTQIYNYSMPRQLQFLFPWEVIIMMYENIPINQSNEQIKNILYRLNLQFMDYELLLIYITFMNNRNRFFIFHI